MIKIGFSGEFFRRLKKLHPELQEETFYKLDLFKDSKNHNILKVHKLKGKLADKYSFSVNYKMRIIFRWLSKSKDHIFVITIDNHDFYK
jgi:plasmid maintenance system killer protein